MNIRTVYDILAIAAFAIFARFAHPPVTLSGLVDAFWPWALGALIGWAFIAFTKPRNLWAEGLIVWLATILGGMGLWILVNGYLPHYSFLIVAATMSALLMFAWRAVVAFRRRRA